MNYNQKKPNTDISGFEVKKIPTVEENFSLNNTLNRSAEYVKNYIKKQNDRFRKSESKVYRKIKEIEAMEEKLCQDT